MQISIETCVDFEFAHLSGLIYACSGLLCPTFKKPFTIGKNRRLTEH